MKINKIRTPVLYNAKCKKQPSYHCQSSQSIISPDIRVASQTEKRLRSAEQSQAAVILHTAGPFLVKIQSAADSDEVNVVRSNLQKMSTAEVDETSSEKVISPRPRPFRPEAPHCSNVY